MRKDITKFFKDHELNITTNTKAKVFNYIDVIQYLSKALYKPYTKDPYNHGCIDIKSIHRKKMLDNLQKSVLFMLSSNTSNKELSNDNVTKYTKALEKKKTTTKRNLSMYKETRT